MLSDTQRAIIIGNILGDGYLSRLTSGSTRLQLKQAERYKDYIMWSYKNLENLCLSKPKQRKDNFQWYVNTRYLQEIGELHSLFYRNGKKSVPINIVKILNSPLSLAVWYMDDGSLDYRPKSHYNYAFSTNCFSVEDNQLLVETLQRNFGIKATIQTPLCRGVRYPELYVGVAGRDKFIKTVKPFILPCFKNKIPPFEL